MSNPEAKISSAKSANNRLSKPIPTESVKGEDSVGPPEKGHGGKPSHIPSTRYINEFVQLRCSPDLLQAKLFPNGKEITESLAAYHATSTHLIDSLPLADDSIQCFVIGDGVVPRTGAVFAFRSHWQVTSIDPKMYLDRGYDFMRLKIRQTQIERFEAIECDRAIIVLVHSHAPLVECVKKIIARNQLSIVAIPCCVQMDSIAGIGPDIEYDDLGIWAAKNTVKVWKNVAGSAH
ncbi:MAG: hypothetical protein GKR89_34295 [Candidatus Latescibacteria bacterium]|nr:hypothetical protein [Candidatus Latescibacterota bacterium]